MSQRSILVTCIITLVFLIGLDSPTIACSCRVQVPPCQAYSQTPVVFIGTPLTVSVVLVERDRHKIPQRLFKFRVEEIFRGIEGKTVEVLTGGGGGDCGYDFRPQTKYLVYGYKQPNSQRIATSICTRTQRLSEASADINYIRNIDKLQAGGTIYGKAERYTVNLETGEWEQTSPIAQAVIIATSETQRFETKTDSNGQYGFSAIPPGKYKVQITLPPKLSPQEEEIVEVSDRGCAEINYKAVTDGRILGTLLDIQGQPVASKTINLLPIVSTNSPSRALWAFTEKNGQFQFKQLPPGRYLLGINLNDAPEKELPYKKTFYPSTTDQTKAEVLMLEEGQHLTGINFRLPPPLIPRQVQGIVVWPDGRPTIKAQVQLTEVISGRMAGWHTKTDDKGQFQLNAFEGVQYKAQATIPADPNWDPNSGKAVALLVTPEVEITPSPQMTLLRLVINTENDGIRRTTTTVRAPSLHRPSKKRKKR